MQILVVNHTHSRRTTEVAEITPCGESQERSVRVYGGVEIIVARLIEPAWFVRIVRDRQPGKVRQAKVKANMACRDDVED